jgi:hypothetical protein
VEELVSLEKRVIKQIVQALRGKVSIAVVVLSAVVTAVLRARIAELTEM